jgi:hypothetical protein
MVYMWCNDGIAQYDWDREDGVEDESKDATVRVINKGEKGPHWYCRE